MHTHTFTATEVKVMGAIHSIAIKLSSCRFMEFAHSVVAVIYGGTLAYIGTTGFMPVAYVPPKLGVAENVLVFGFLILTFGVTGLTGFVLRGKWLRLVSSVGLAVLWGWLAMYYYHSLPPFPVEVAIYGCESVIEACIFIRVYADLDKRWH